jgi:tRNA(fMet)-specific endonuclease VapC
MTKRYLLDCNHLSEAIRPVSPTRERLRHAHRRGIALGTCVPVLCELECGILQTADPNAYRRALGQVLRFVRLWPLDQKVAEVYGEIFLELKRRGRVLSTVDIMLVALAKIMGLTILTSDKDFEALPEIPAENWLS